MVSISGPWDEIYRKTPKGPSKLINSSELAAEFGVPNFDDISMDVKLNQILTMLVS